METISLETLHDILKTYELELFQKRVIQPNQRNKMANTSSALMAQQPILLQLPESSQSQIKIEDVVEDEDKVTLDLKDVEDE